MNNSIICELFEDGKKMIKLEKIQTFIFSERPRKGIYSRLPNAQKCKLQQEKLKAKSNDFLTNENGKKKENGGKK